MRAILGTAIDSGDPTGLIGFLAATAPVATAVTVEPLKQGLADLGFVEGEHYARVEPRWAAFKVEQLAANADQLVRLPNMKVIVAATSGPAMAAKAATERLAQQQQTDLIPVVMAFAADPCLNGLVCDVVRPDCHVTGLAAISAQLIGKQADLLKLAVPDIEHLVVVTSRANRAHDKNLQAIQAAARALGLSVTDVPVPAPGDSDPLEDRLTSAIGERRSGIVILGGPSTLALAERLVNYAGTRYPAIYPEKRFAEMGGLMAYALDVPGLYRRTVAVYVAKILRGARPRDLPVQEPSRLELTMNRVTADGFGGRLDRAIFSLADFAV